MEFASSSSCRRKDGAPPSGVPETYCLLRINVGQRYAGPSAAAGYDFVFDSQTGTFGETAEYEGHAIERSITLTEGTYNVRVQFWAHNWLGFDLIGWHLTVKVFDK
ncbi:MAG: hypothetical protein WEB00_01055 [Dehalococcoidia bacterium]